VASFSKVGKILDPALRSSEGKFHGLRFAHVRNNVIKPKTLSTHEIEPGERIIGVPAP
jgi:hypothetical protein